MRSIFALAIVVLFTACLATSARANDGVAIVAVPSTFSPQKVTLHVGETTVLHFTKTEGVHSIQSDDLQIPQTLLTPGKDVDVAVTPKKAGTFVIHCGVVCGGGHDNMTLTIVVES